MGSGATTIVGYLVLLAIIIFRPTKRKWTALTTMVVVYTGDLPLYAILPRLGLRHFIVIGGTHPEPLAGAVAVGVPEWAFFVFVAVDILLVCSLLTYSLLRLKRDNARSKNQTA